jgi:hypothetical protein
MNSLFLNDLKIEKKAECLSQRVRLVNNQKKKQLREKYKRRIEEDFSRNISAFNLELEIPTKSVNNVKKLSKEEQVFNKLLCNIKI